MTTRVLHVLRSAQRDWTGIASVIAQTLPPLARRGYQSDALFLGAGGPLTEHLALAGAKVSLVQWSGGWRDPAGAMRYWRFVREGRYDIVHTHVGGRLLLSLSRRATGSRVILHVHSRVREVDDQYVQSHIHTAGADAVVAVSKSVADVIDGTDTTVIYSGVAMPSVPPSEGGAPRPQIIGAVGRLTKGKGYADLIRALPLIPGPVCLEIAGDGPSRDSLVALARELGVEARVTLLGWVNDTAPLHARWTLLAHPSHEEGFGLAVVEAMAAGLPVIATPAGGVSEVINDGESGLLVPIAQPEKLAAAINRVLGDSALAARLGTSARDRVARHFSVEQQVDATDHLYQSLLRETGRRGLSATALE